MRLREHPHPHWPLLELEEKTLQHVLELRLQESSYLREGDRRHRTRRQCELRRHIRRKNVAPSREHMPQLHERRPQLFQRQAQPDRDPADVSCSASQKEPPAEYVSEPVTGANLGDPGRPSGRPFRQSLRDVLHFHGKSIAAIDYLAAASIQQLEVGTSPLPVAEASTYPNHDSFLPRGLLGRLPGPRNA